MIDSVAFDLESAQLLSSLLRRFHGAIKLRDGGSNGRRVGWGGGGVAVEAEWIEMLLRIGKVTSNRRNAVIR